MDIPQKSKYKGRSKKQIISPLLVLGLIPATTIGLSRLKPAAPSVDRATVLVDTVKRGPMLLQVRGIGTLVPEEIRVIPAINEGVVEKLPLKQGMIVKPDTILVELSNPELQLSALDSEFQLKAAEAQFTDLRVKLESEILNQKAAAATVQADYNQAKLELDANEELYKKGLLSDLNLKLSQNKAEELATRHSLEQKRIEISSESVTAQLAAQQTRIDQL